MPRQRILRAATRVLHGTGIALFVVMCLLVLAQVVARKFFEPLVWSEELARYVFIWVCFLGWLIATQKKSHIRISLVTDRAGPRLKLALGVFADLAVMALATLFVVKGVQLVRNNADIETVTLFFGFWLVYLVVPLAAASALVVSACDLVALCRGEAHEKEIVL